MDIFSLACHFSFLLTEIEILPQRAIKPKTTDQLKDESTCLFGVMS